MTHEPASTLLRKNIIQQLQQAQRMNLVEEVSVYRYNMPLNKTELWISKPLDSIKTVYVRFHENTPAETLTILQEHINRYYRGRLEAGIWQNTVSIEFLVP